ncbi:MAG TPA: hypothetical protein VKP67_08820 [Xanthobacteraceae bacterium]|nr:hypothetical protein [Xanthobacteraceae bacterium]
MMDPLSKIATTSCEYPKIQALTKEQRAALHVFKHEFLAAGYRVYRIVPVKDAAPIFADMFGAAVADRSAEPMHKIATTDCDYPKIEGLTKEQRAALHVFKHELLAAGFRLYQEVPVKLAAPILIDMFGAGIALEKIEAAA